MKTVWIFQQLETVYIGLFHFDGIEGYVMRDTVDRYKHINDPGWFKTLNATRVFVESQKIKYIIVDGRYRNRYSLDTIINDCRCNTPRYAPDSVMHLNCYKYRKEKLIDWYIYGDRMAPPLKEGIWKTYYPNHIIESQGMYKDDKKIGLFRFYDQNGILINTIDYNSKNSRKQKKP